MAQCGVTVIAQWLSKAYYLETAVNENKIYYFYESFYYQFTIIDGNDLFVTGHDHILLLIFTFLLNFHMYSYRDDNLRFYKSVTQQ